MSFACPRDTRHHECLIKISKLLNVELSDILIVDNEEI